jgi:tRNA threonylcarbamoyl adenosine modification protein YeaZ
MSDSPLILAVDTTSEYGSLALRRGEETLTEMQIQATDGFAQVIFQGIERMLAQSNTRLDEIDCFAAASGPGSFTGVRVSLSVVKGLAEAMGKPARGISNLRALSVFGTAPLRAVALDARRGEVYGAVYDAQGRIVVPESVALWGAWIETVPEGAELIGWADGPCQSAGVKFTAAARWLAGAVALCAEMDGPARWQDPGALDANYVRRADAELYWKDRQAD